MSNPWSKFFWSDWSEDPALRLCSFGAQGLWMRMLCIAAAHDPIGYVAVAGRPLSETDIARMTGGSESEVAALLGELTRNGVFSRDRHRRIYSRRMVRDARKAATARKNGKNGGNPSLRKNEGKPALDKGWDKPPLKPQEPEARSQSSLEDKSSRAAIVPREDPDKVAWSLAKLVLSDQGGMTEARASAFFGKLLAENRLRARDLTKALAATADSGTQDPRGYLTKAAQRIDAERSAPVVKKAVGFV